MFPAATAFARVSGGTGSVGCTDGTLTWSPKTLWPPNHKLRTVRISYADAQPSHSVGMRVNSISSDQGTNNFEPDFTGVGNSDTASESPVTTSVRLRSERDGGDSTGRVYSISVTCIDFTEDQSETVTIAVTVPHDASR
jgi:hypothetical protein